MRSDIHKLRDTIVAPATFPGAAAVGIVKLSGPDALRIVAAMFVPKRPKDLTKVATYTLHYGWIVDKKKTAIDEVLIAVMRKPYSHTAEDVVEIQSHAGSYVVDRILSLCVAQGARLAEPGEFSKRAFLNGRIDLVQAEGVLDVVAASGEESLRLGMAQVSGRLSAAIAELESTLDRAYAYTEAELSFPEDVKIDLSAVRADIATARAAIGKLLLHAEKARVYRDGISCVICGLPNAGKSSLLNMLLSEERVIVSSVAGTTRDVIQERLTVRGVPLVIADTAGILRPRDAIEDKAVARSYAAIDDADMVLLVIDASVSFSPKVKALCERLRGRNALVVLNKADRAAKVTPADFKEYRFPCVRIAAKTHDGLPALEEAIVKASKAGALPKTQDVFVSNKRHIGLLSRAREALTQAAGLCDNDSDRIMLHVRDARDAVREVLGRGPAQDVLDSVFSQFCIGK